MNSFPASIWKHLWRESGILAEGDRFNCMIEAVLCEHVSMNLQDWRCCCAAVCECLCFRHSSCCLWGEPFKSVGLYTSTADGEYCRLNFPCCDCAIIPPRLLCGRATQVLCLYNTGAFPCDDEYLTEPVCAYYFVSCYPRPGCCVAPPRSKALQKLLNPGVEHIQALELAPDGEEMDRCHASQSSSLSELKRKNSDDRMDTDMDVV